MHLFAKTMQCSKTNCKFQLKVSNVFVLLRKKKLEVAQWSSLSSHSKRVLCLNKMASWGLSVCSLQFVFPLPDWVQASSNSSQTC